MPKLYYTSTSCGASSFISAHIAGLHLDCEQVDLATHLTASGVDFYTINPKGNVPTIALDSGIVLNENAATLQWIADQATAVKVGPANGTPERYELEALLSFVGTELHATVGPLFNPTTGKEVVDFIHARLATKLKYLDDHVVKGKSFVQGNAFTVADGYLYIVLSWSPYIKVDLDPYPNVKSYYEGIANLEGVKSATARMGTSPATTA